MQGKRQIGSQPRKMSVAGAVRHERFLAGSHEDMIAAAAGTGSVRLPTSTLTVRVADITTRVVCDDPTLTLTMSEASRLFLVEDGNADATIHVKTTPWLDMPTGEQLFDSGAAWRMYRESGTFVFSFVSAAMRPPLYRVARFDPSFSCGEISVNDVCLPADRAIAPLEYPLDELLMINLLSRGRGVEIHGCAVIDQEGTAHLFAGQSEAGKTTNARLWHEQGATVLSDERVILRVRDELLWVYGTPWHGEGQFAAPASAPLAGIFFLAHGRDNAVRRVTGAECVARLFACCFPPFHDRAGVQFTLD